MPDVLCPRCSRVIPVDDLNIAEGVGLCRGCNGLWRLAELAQDPEDGQSDRAVESGGIPSGCRLEDDGRETMVRATCRGPMGCFFLAFSLFWNSITSVFVAVAAGSLYQHVIGPLPSWFPTFAGSKKGGLSAGMSLGMTIGLCVFLIPFVAVGIGTFLAAAMGLLGRVEVRLREGRGTVFTGIGPLGLRRGFDATLVREVRVRLSKSETNGKPDRSIVIEADNRVELGGMLTEPRRRWMAGVLRKILLPQRRTG